MASFLSTMIELWSERSCISRIASHLQEASGTDWIPNGTRTTLRVVPVENSGTKGKIEKPGGVFLIPGKNVYEQKLVFLFFQTQLWCTFPERNLSVWIFFAISPSFEPSGLPKKARHAPQQNDVLAFVLTVAWLKMLFTVILASLQDSNDLA